MPDQLEAIAVVGVACRFPGANSPEQFWRNLLEGKESTKFFSDEELRKAGVPESHLKDPNYVKAAPLVDNADHFDAALFGLSPAEARLTDPQHRLFLECSWEALEQAGYDPVRFERPIGLFAGCSINQYLLRMLEQNSRLIDAQGLLQIMIGAEKDFLATRVAYLLNLRGPAMTIQTACSTSLVAVRLACQSLWNYECDMALAGGATVRAPRISGYFFREGEIYSPDGHCRAFDERASGTIFGEGAGVVVLKRLEDALSDGDMITAVVRGVAINNDGSRKAGFTAPSVEGQAEVIAAAMAMADVEPDTVGMVEAHGTGTQLGDPIEVAALLQVFGERTSEDKRCALGSVKTNFGHLDAAAGIAGFIKAALAVKSGSIPPSLHFDHPNPHLGLDRTPFYVPTGAAAWPELIDRHGCRVPRRAGVSSFGVGGTNVHAVLEEPPKLDHERLSSGKPRLVIFSAGSADALGSVAANLGNRLRSSGTETLDDVAYTLNVGRHELRYRGYLVARDGHHAAETLLAKEFQSQKAPRDSIRPIFMFPGQGSQYPTMVRDLYRDEHAFRKHLDNCAELLLPVISSDIRSVLLPEPGTESACAELMMQTAWTQPALFCVEYSLAMLLRDWGIAPAAMIGHSIGEYVAAVLAGVFTPEEALRLVALRGRIMQEQPRGALLAILLPEDQVLQYMGNRLELALVNSPSHCVVGGPAEEIESLKEKLNAKKVKYTELRASHAFHTWMMDGARDKLALSIASLVPKEPKIPFISNLTGTWITAEQASNPRYWAEQMRQTVRFSQGIRTMLDAGHRVFLEVGPGVTLSTFLQYHIDAEDTIGLPMLRPLKRSGYETVLEAIGSLWSRGTKVDWPAIYQGENRGRISLPTYPFEGPRYWCDDGDLQERPKGNPTTDDVTKELDSDTTLDRDLIIKALTGIWRDLLGEEDIGTNVSFFDLGGSSLLAAQLSARVKQQLGKPLPLAALIQAPTIGQLADFLHNAEAQERSWASLVPIRAGGNKPMLFLVHGAEGNILILRDLAALLTGVQVFGLQSRGLDGQGGHYEDIPAMAAQYIKEIRSVQPTGPYVLGGYCMGGLIALEMAQQLLAGGERVSLVAMVETYNAHALDIKPTLTYRAVFGFQKTVFHIINWLHAPETGRKRFLTEKLQAGRLKAHRAITRITKLVGRVHGESIHSELARINDRAFFSYVPQPFAGKIVLFRPRISFWKQSDPDCGWKEIARNEVDVRVINAAPQGLLIQPYVRETATELNQVLLSIVEN